MRKTKFLYIVIALLAISQIYSRAQIRNLKAEIQQTKNSITYMEERLNGNISSVYSNVDKKLAEQASIVSFLNYEVGEFNLETLKVPITFRVQPKILAEATEVSLKFGEEMVSMEREDTAFVLTKEFTITDEILPTIVVEDNGIQQFEKNDSLNVYDIKNEVFPSLYPDFHGNSRYNHEGPYHYYLQGEIEVKFNSDTQNSFHNIKYIVTIDDEVKKTYNNDSSNSGTIQIDDMFELREGQILIGKVVATNDLNYMQEYIITRYVAGEKEPPFGYYENEKITAPDGTVIYEFNENEL